MYSLDEKEFYKEIGKRVIFLVIALTIIFFIT